MSGAVIQGEGLGKRYRRGMTVDSGLRHALERFVKSPLAAFRKKEETFWALKDVSLHVNEGEVLGLIGRNGAGKTTLLKILSRITKPTTGWAEIHGRVGSLLEVGTGFHPELTGRENTFLSGAILGMRKQEIVRKFDEIVAFAELEKSIDTPVKHYSSGMYVRLAFAVAAHLEPEILLVDEVLAVGDINFRRSASAKWAMSRGRDVPSFSSATSSIRFAASAIAWSGWMTVQFVSVEPPTKSSPRTKLLCHVWMEPSRRGAIPKSLKPAFLGGESMGRISNPLYRIGSLGPVTVRFRLEVARPIRRGSHGVALYNMDRQLIWANAAYGLTFEPGIHELVNNSSFSRCDQVPIRGTSPYMTIRTRLIYGKPFQKKW